MIMLERDVVSICPLDLKKSLDKGEAIQVIDIRETEELLICNLSFSKHVPMAKMVEKPELCDSNYTYVFVCRSGKRATALWMTMMRKYELKNIKILEGGVLNWIEKVDSRMEKY